MASPTNARTLAEAHARRFLNRLASLVNRAQRSPGIDEVHDLRVTIRKFMRVLLVFKPCFPAKEVKRVQRSLKKTMTVAGRVRDLDIAVGLLGKSRLAEAAVVRSRLQGRRKKAGRSLADRLRRPTKRRMISKWRSKLLLPAIANTEGSIEDLANDTLPRLVTRFFALGNHAARERNDQARLHRLRIAAKKLRYTLELFGPLYEPVLPVRIGQLKKLQTLLGNIHDTEVVRGMASKEGAGGKLAGELTKRMNRKVEKFWSCWKTEFAGAAVPGKRPVQSESARRLARDTSSATG